MKRWWRRRRDPRRCRITEEWQGLFIGRRASVVGMSGQERDVEALARTIYEATADASEAKWLDMVDLGLDSLYRMQAEAVLVSDVVARIEAEVWDEAYSAGLDDAHDHSLGLASGRENPYRALLDGGKKPCGERAPGGRCVMPAGHDGPHGQVGLR